jgi:cysteine-rich repeat protein
MRRLALLTVLALGACSKILGIDHFSTGGTPDAQPDASHDAYIPSCGNGTVDPGEDCDTHGADTATCVGSTCKLSTCGDGHTNANATPPELCDPPNDPTLPNYDPGKPRCSATCQTEFCGNNVTDPGEPCDNGTNTAGSGCYMCMSNETCGNGYVDTQLPDHPSTNVSCAQGSNPPPSGVLCAEVCDPPNVPGLPGYDASKPLCSRNCLSNMTCGNGIIDTDVGEVCDPPNLPGLPGYDPSKPQCNGSCTGGATCGNGIVDPGEQCDSGGVDTATCNGPSAGAVACKVPVCGDGYNNAAAGEQCDPGTVGTDTATCNSNCTVPMCGDGHLNTAAGEQCDDHNTSACGTCSANCQTPQTGHNCPAGTGCNAGADCSAGLTCNSSHVCQ